jgi:hypothetical protein
MEFQNVYVLQFVKSFTIYYIKCVCPRIWVSRLCILHGVVIHLVPPSHGTFEETLGGMEVPSFKPEWSVTV